MSNENKLESYSSGGITLAANNIHNVEEIECALRQSLERYNQLVQNIPVGVYIWYFGTDGNGMGFRYVSKKFCEILGVCEADVLKDAQAAFRPIHPDDVESLISYNRNTRKSLQSFRWEGRFYVKDEIRWIRIASEPTALANGCSEWHGFVEDITTQKLAAQALERSIEQSEALAHAKSEFLANMSHEIRTPMNGIIGLSQLALNLPMSDELRDYLTKIADSSRSLMGILNDILDFSKLEAGKMRIDLAPFNLHGVLDSVRNMFANRAIAKGISFEIKLDRDVPCSLRGDALRIQQILSNLVSNAIKFTERGRVVLNIVLERRNGNVASIGFAVSDTGIGIDKQNIDKLFQSFSQVDHSATRRFSGTGLGLSISRNLLNLMGGEFRVVSHVGEGTVIAFELALEVLSEETPHAPQYRHNHSGGLAEHLSGSAAEIKGAHILVVEDNYINQVVVGEILKLAGMTISCANDGQEALDCLVREEFTAVLMDVHMPVMDGIEATKRIRAQPQFQQLPIIALTADVLEDEQENCRTVGMNDFVAKPIDPEALIDTLLRWVDVA